MSDKPKHPGGRPSEFKQEYCAMVKEFLKKGYAKVEIAAELEVNRNTLDKWCLDYPEFHSAMNDNLDLSEGWWTKQGRTNLSSKDFNSRLYEINMMNRFGWMKKAESKNDVVVRQEDAIDNLK